MRFIKRKNLLEGEELQYVPELHWMFIFRPIVRSIPFFLILIFLKVISNSTDGFSGLTAGAGDIQLINDFFKYIFLISIGVVLLVFIWRILQYMNIEYGLTNKRLIIKKGVCRIITVEIPTDRIESIYCLQGIFGRIFRYGTICISGVGGKMPVFFMVRSPYALRRKIAEIIEKNKRITVMHGELPKAPVKPVPKAKEDPLYLFGTYIRVVS